MKRNEIYNEFNKKLENESNINIIKYIDEHSNYIDKFFYYSCGSNKLFIIKYILKNYDVYFEDPICNCIKYGHNHIIKMLFDFAVKHNEYQHEYLLKNIDFYFTFMEKCISRSNIEAIPLITHYYSKGDKEFQVNFDSSLNKALAFSYLTPEKLNSVLNYKYFKFTPEIKDTFTQLIFLGKYEFALIIFDNLKELLIDVNKSSIVDLISNIVLEYKHQHYILPLCDFFDVKSHLKQNKKEPELLETINKIYIQYKIEDF